MESLVGNRFSFASTIQRGYTISRSGREVWDRLTPPHLKLNLCYSR
jgi:hypothetical protein